MCLRDPSSCFKVIFYLSHGEPDPPPDLRPVHLVFADDVLVGFGFRAELWPHGDEDDEAEDVEGEGEVREAEHSAQAVVEGLADEDTEDKHFIFKHIICDVQLLPEERADDDDRPHLRLRVFPDERRVEHGNDGAEEPAVERRNAVLDQRPRVERQELEQEQFADVGYFIGFLVADHLCQGCRDDADEASQACGPVMNEECDEEE